jgi:hypothetical protein
MDSIFEIFNEYGWWGILGILICCGLFVGAKYIANRLTSDMSTGLEKVGETLTNQLAEQNKQLTEVMIGQQEKLIDYLVNKEKDKENNHSNMLNERMILADDINMKLKDIMNIHNSQRAFILEFHNSYQNLSGVPFAKYSCNYEWFDKGLVPLGYRMIGLPFSSIAKIVMEVIKSPNQQIVYEDSKSLTDDNPTLETYMDDNITTTIFTGLHDNNNILIGLLVLEYHTNINPKKINLRQLSIQGAELTSILNIRYKYTK